MMWFKQSSSIATPRSFAVLLKISENACGVGGSTLARYPMRRRNASSTRSRSSRLVENTTSCSNGTSIFLPLCNVRKIEVPFEQLVVFSTNLDERDLVD